MGHKLITGPAVEPVTLTEAKGFLRVDHTADDDLIDALIAEARTQVELETGRSLLPTTWRLTLDEFPVGHGGVIRLPRSPLRSVTSITYYDASGISTTLNASQYQVDATDEPGRIAPAVDVSWPDTQDDRLGAVAIAYVAGYTDADAVPGPLKRAVLQLVAHWYEMRVAVSSPGAYEVPMGLRRLLSTWWTGYVQ